MSRKLEISSPNLRSPLPNSKVRKAFKCPLKSPLTNECNNIEESPTASKRKFEDLNDSSSSSKQNLASTPKCLKSTKSRNLAFHSPFRSPLTKSSNETKENLKEKLDTLLKEEEDLDKQIIDLEKEGFNAPKVQDHIDQLHKYNDMKDAAQIVLGRLAEIYGISLKEIHSKYEAPSED